MRYGRIAEAATPRLSLRAGGRAVRAPAAYSPDAKHVMRYEAKEHAKQPHILKFSGGRSSGMLLFTLLRSGQLKRERGDVIVFNNTSAEHSRTYEFVAECKRIAERRYGIPFFWLEFQTYEDMGRSGWTRFPSYRLVQPVPKSRKEPDGYDRTGAVFEEMLSWKGYVPNIHSRICTETLKLFVTSEFVRDWLGNRNSLIEQGHFGKPCIDAEQTRRHHEMNGGSTPASVLIAKKKFVNARPAGRPEQKFEDYSDCKLGDRRGTIKNVVTSGGRAMLAGENAAEYVSLVGFRADEPLRLAKMRYKNNGNGTNGGGNGYSRSDGEHLYAPLEYLGVDTEDVRAFWKKQEAKLRLPHHVNTSNCVYCFLKGKSILKGILDEQRLAARGEKRRWPVTARKNSPESIDWWIKMEQRYARDLDAEKRVDPAKNGSAKGKKIGFFGLTKSSSHYKEIKLVKTASGKRGTSAQPLGQCANCYD